MIGKIDPLGAYTKLLNNLTYCSIMERHVWAHRFMEMGRRDLALLGWLALIKEPDLPPELRLHILDAVGYVYYVLGKSDKVRYYWGLLGELRRSWVTPTTPKTYRILGKTWYSSIGHIAFLDYYVKHLQLSVTEEIRIVAPWSFGSLPGLALFKKISECGIVLLKPEALEADYNDWAEARGYRSWEALTALEKMTLVDEMWRYDFPLEGVQGRVDNCSPHPTSRGLTAGSSDVEGS